MELDYKQLKKEFDQIFKNNGIWFLATSDGSRVSCRAMSIIYDGSHIYFQTSKQLDKYKQLVKNNHIALCCSNVSVEGIAYDIGVWENNPQIKELYIRHHKGSYDAYGTAHDQVVIKIVPQYAVFWKYIDGSPARDFLYIDQKKAERHFYFDSPANE